MDSRAAPSLDIISHTGTHTGALPGGRLSHGRALRDPPASWAPARSGAAGPGVGARGAGHRRWGRGAGVSTRLGSSLGPRRPRAPEAGARIPGRSAVPAAGRAGGRGHSGEPLWGAALRFPRVGSGGRSGPYIRRSEEAGLPFPGARAPRAPASGWGNGRRAWRTGSTQSFAVSRPACCGGRPGKHTGSRNPRHPPQGAKNPRGGPRNPAPHPAWAGARAARSTQERERESCWGNGPGKARLVKCE